MAGQVLRFVELSDTDRETGDRLSRLGAGDHVEVRIKRRGGAEEAVALPPKAAERLEAILARLLDGDRIAVLSQEQELSPKAAADLLGVSRPLVVHRMDIGDLPFRYVGKHRRTTLKNVLSFKAKFDAQHVAMQALADDAEELSQLYGV